MLISLPGVWPVQDSTIRIWDISTEQSQTVQQIRDIFDGEVVTSVDFQNSGRHYLFATTESSLFAFDLRKTSEAVVRTVSSEERNFANRNPGFLFLCCTLITSAVNFDVLSMPT